VYPAGDSPDHRSNEASGLEEVRARADAAGVRLGDPSALAELDRLDGRAFERAIGELLDRLGHTVETTDWFDHGADLVVVRAGERTAVQVKRARSPVRQSAVQTVVTAKAVYGCERAMVVTNSSFTGRARALAAANDVELWGRAELTEALLSFCMLCERRLSDRVRGWCLDRPADYGGRVYCFDHQRRFGGILRTA
jgi:restriction system protein